MVEKRSKYLRHPHMSKWIPYYAVPDVGLLYSQVIKAALDGIGINMLTAPGLVFSYK